MLFNIKPPDKCYDCVFCEELNFCKLLCGRHIGYEDRPSFCPFVTDENDAFLCDGVTKVAHAFDPEMYELTKREIYEAAKSQFILDYNYQRKQVHKMKRKENTDIEHAKHWRVLAGQFDQRANDTFDKIMQLVELINQEKHASIKG